jgi:DNA topoisomerase I
VTLTGAQINERTNAALTEDQLQAVADWMVEEGIGRDLAEQHIGLISFERREGRLPDAPSGDRPPIVVPRKSLKDYDPHQRRDERGRWARQGFHWASDDERKEWVIPPAWREVQVNDDPAADMQVVGIDAKNRPQYRYSQAHMERQAVAKFKRTQALNERYQRLERALLAAAQNDDDAALGVLLIARTGFRPGSESDTGAAKQAFGVSTLKAKHVKVQDDWVSFDFTGKSGKRQRHNVKDAVLARLLENKLKDAEPGQQVFRSSAQAMRDRLHQDAPEFKLKDLRTRMGTAVAKRAMSKTPAPRDRREYAQARNKVGDAVAKALGNTRTVALSSYIDPTVFADWDARIAKMEENS